MKKKKIKWKKQIVQDKSKAKKERKKKERKKNQFKKNEKESEWKRKIERNKKRIGARSKKVRNKERKKGRKKDNVEIRVNAPPKSRTSTLKKNRSTDCSKHFFMLYVSLLPKIWQVTVCHLARPTPSGLQIELPDRNNYALGLRMKQKYRYRKQINKTNPYS